MRNAVLFLLVLAMLLGRVSAEVELVDYLYGPSAVNAVLEEGDYIYAGTDVGLFRISLSDLSRELFHIANSGLQAQRVLCLGSRSDGSIWIGTSSGLFKLVDGVISHVQSTQPIFCLSVDSQDRVWFGIDESYSGTALSSVGMITAADEFVHLTNLPSPNCIYCDDQNRLYLGYPSGLEVRLVGGTGPGIYHYNTNNTPLPDNNIRDIKADAAGGIWLITNYGLSRFYQYNWTVWSQPSNSYILANARQLSISGTTVWIASPKGLLSFDGTNITTYPSATYGYPDVPITSVYAGSSTWFGLTGHLLSQTNGSTTNTPLFNTDLKSNQLSSCYIDPWDNAWLSYYDSPWISKITNDGIDHIPAPDDGPYDYDLCGNSARGLYLSTQSGRLYHWINEQWVQLGLSLSFSSIRGTPWQDKLLYTSRGLGIIVVDNEAVSYINTTTPDYTINNSYNIAVDPQLRIWFDNRALYSIDDGVITQQPPFIDNLMTRCMAAAPDGSIWIGVLNSDYDLVRYDPQTTLYSPLALPGDSYGARHLVIDSEGYLWITGDRSMYIYRQDRNFSTVFEYPNHDYDLVDLVLDNDNRVWVLTEQGVFIFENSPTASDDPITVPPADLIQDLFCYPNPFLGTMSISLELRDNAFTTIEVYNLRGQLVRTLSADTFIKGKNSLQWDGRDNAGASCPTGVYLIKASSGKETLNRKILIP